MFAMRGSAGFDRFDQTIDGAIAERIEECGTTRRESRSVGASLVACTMLALSSMSLIAGCGEIFPRDSVFRSSYRSSSLRPAPQPVENHYETKPPARIVKASWYGAGLSGHRTASGERFDPNRMTAASKTLPIGSVVHVTNLENGRSVTVRINDRGPYTRGRSLDLSHRAAREIGLTGTGVGRVMVTPVPAHSEAAAVDPTLE